ncbi:MAG: molybdopterin-dependent oxidoreductase [Pseudomonadota bacterium]
MSYKSVIFGAAIAALSALPSLAELAQPEGRVVLSVSGAIAEHNDDGIAHFDIDMLRDLEWREIETFTSFTTGPQQFAGPTLASLLKAVRANGDKMNAKAINDYFVEIPTAHADAHNVILALEMNGKRMRIRDKGPIWVVYPLTEAQAAKKPFDTEMIWQLDRIEVLQ